jgi:gluconokinase
MGGGTAESLVLALDIGTSSVRTALFDVHTARVAETLASASYSLRYSADGAAELDPALLLSGTVSCLRKTLRAHSNSAAHRSAPITAIGASGFWHSLLGTNSRGEATTPVFTWADSRCLPDAASLRERISERRVHTRTGCMVRFSYWPAKLLWLRRTQRRLFVETARWISPADWVLEQIFGARLCSASMASGTGFYKLRKGEWDLPLLDACGIDPDKMPQLIDAGFVKGTTMRSLREAKVFAAIGDGAASNIGAGADTAAIVAINVGTSAAVRIVQQTTLARSSATPSGLFRYVVDMDRTLLGGAVSNAGNLRAWCIRELNVDGKPEQIERALDRRLAANGTLVVLPFWVNERAPTWPEKLDGTVAGLNQSTTAADILRDTTSAVFYRLGEILEKIEATAGRSRAIVVSGGILKSPAALRLLADSLGRDLFISNESEASLRGAAVHALRQIGVERSIPMGRKVLRHDASLFEKHCARRATLNSLEQRLAREVG